MKRINSFFIYLIFVVSVCVMNADTNDGLRVENLVSKEALENKIKGSYGFLSQREPALNQGEYAIVENFYPFSRMIPILPSR